MEEPSGDTLPIEGAVSVGTGFGTTGLTTLPPELVLFVALPSMQTPYAVYDTQTLGGIGP